MSQESPRILVYRGECENKMDCLKKDLKEIIVQERTERKEGERDLKTELSTGINGVQADIKSMRNAVWGLSGTLIVAIIVAVLEFILGKI